MHDRLILGIFAALGLIALCLGYVVREARRAPEEVAYDERGHVGLLDAELDADR